MEFGVGLFPTGPADQMVQRAVLAEELGFDAFWVADTHLIWREAWVLLGAIAQRTSRIALGPGVTHPIVRHPTLIAAAIATLHELAPGRVHLGIGIGDSGPANMGQRRATLAELEAAVCDIRALLGGKAINQTGTTMRLAYAAEPGVNIYVAGASDRTHRMSGRVADGALVAGALDELGDSIAAIRAGEDDGGRPAGSTRVVLFTTACVDDDEATAHAAVRAIVARKAILSLGRAARLGRIAPEDQEPLNRLQQAYETQHHMDARYAELVPDRWVERFALGGTPDRILARCRRATADGVDQIAVVFSGPDPAVQMRTFASRVIAPLQGTAFKGKGASF